MVDCMRNRKFNMPVAIIPSATAFWNKTLSSQKHSCSVQMIIPTYFKALYFIKYTDKNSVLKKYI